MVPHRPFSCTHYSPNCDRRRLRPEGTMFEFDFVSVPMLLVLAAFGALALLVISGIRYIPNNMVGIIEKRWSAKGSLPTGFIAMNGEAGFQPEVLRGGVHFLMP